MANTEDNGGCDNESTTESHKPRNVPLRLWEKFQALEKRTNETTKRSTEKRIKHLQKTALENVSRALNNPEDRAIVDIPPLTDGQTKQGSDAASLPGPSSGACRKRSAEDDLGSTEREDKKTRTSTMPPVTGKSEEKTWQEVRGLMGVNDHLAGVSHGSLGPKTVLETKIETAIASGDFRKAEELSDYMADREFGEKVAKAIDAKNFLQHKQEEEERAKAKQKKKLHWGFEAKHRWETKSNM